jgi:hypothetical protein
MATVFECARLRPESDLGWWAAYRASVDEHDAPAAFPRVISSFPPLVRPTSRRGNLPSSTTVKCRISPPTVAGVKLRRLPLPELPPKEPSNRNQYDRTHSSSG